MVVELSNVSKKYYVKKRVNKICREKTSIDAIKDLCFSINDGEIVGYLGVNGAGKSTTIKMITGILLPTEGTVRVFGKDPYKCRKIITKDIGVVFGQRSQLIWDLPAIDTFNLFSKIYEIPKSEYKETLNNIVLSMNMEEIIKTPVRHLSLGQRMCCEIACALLHKPKLILLDEPTIGLDIVNKEKVRKFILEQNKINGTTIMLTTHDIGDVEKLCNRIVIINAGTKIYDDTLNELKNRYGKTKKIKVDFNSSVTQEYINKVNNLSFKAYLSPTNDKSMYIEYDSDIRNSSDVIKNILKMFIGISNISVIERDFEDILSDIFKYSSCSKGIHNVK